MGRKTSIYIPDDLEPLLRKDGRPLAEILRAGVTAKKPAARTRRAERATRVPADFTPTEAMKQWARERAPHIGWDEHDRFMDFWRGVPGARGEKLDWEGTWRNWMRKAEEQAPGSRLVKTRDQEATDQMFNRMWERAVRKDEADERQGDRGIGPPPPRSLPGPED